MSDNSNSADPTAEEVSFLTPQDAARIKEFIIVEAVDGLFYGVELLLVLSAVYLLLQKGLGKSASRWLMLFSSILLFTGSTMLLSGNIIISVSHIEALGDDPTYNPLPIMVKWSVIGAVWLRINYLAGSFVVTWRAWILYGRKSLCHSVLSAAILFCVASGIADLVLAIHDVNRHDFGIGSHARFIFPVALLILIMTSLTFIGLKIWENRDFVRDNLGDGTVKSAISQTFILSVEAGVGYFIIWILNLLTATGAISGFGGDYMRVIVPHCVITYPIIIILLIIMKKSHCETTLVRERLAALDSGPAGNNTRNGVVSQPIRFQARPGASVSFMTGTHIGTQLGHGISTRGGTGTDHHHIQTISLGAGGELNGSDEDINNVFVQSKEVDNQEKKPEDTQMV